MDGFKDAPPSYADSFSPPQPHSTLRQPQPVQSGTTKRHPLLAAFLIILKAALFAGLGYLMVTQQGPFKPTTDHNQQDTLSQYKTTNAASTVLSILAMAWMGVVRRLGVVGGLFCVVSILVDSYLCVFAAAHAGPSGAYLYSLLVPNVGALYLYTHLGKD